MNKSFDTSSTQNNILQTDYFELTRNEGYKSLGYETKDAASIVWFIFGYFLILLADGLNFKISHLLAVISGYIVIKVILLVSQLYVVNNYKTYLKRIVKIDLNDLIWETTYINGMTNKFSFSLDKDVKLIEKDSYFILSGFSRYRPQNLELNTFLPKRVLNDEQKILLRKYSQ